MTFSDDDDENLAQFLESEVLSEVSDKEEENVEEPQAKRKRVEEAKSTNQNQSSDSSLVMKNNVGNNRVVPRRIETGDFSKVPPELFHHILKFLSSEDLVSCSLVCRFLNYAASDEALWHRLYCMRWGILPPTRKLREYLWKKLYIQRDQEDMVELVRSCQNEFKEYYIQMQAAKRSQAPHPSQLKDDTIILDKTLADQVSAWKSSRGLSDIVVTDHACSGVTCSYYHIGDVFICEKTGQVHVCDDTCREASMDSANQLLICTISGRCFDTLMETDDDVEQQQDEAEPFMGSGRFARAYTLGYNCTDEKELLEATLRFC